MINFTDEQINVLETALDEYGYQNQSDILIEEMAELTKAIIKHRRYGSAETFDDLCEEVADVAIMLQQMLLCTTDVDYDSIVKSKIDRLAKRFDNTLTCIGVSSECVNLEESFGEICVKCNGCGRFDCSKDGNQRIG